MFTRFARISQPTGFPLFVGLVAVSWLVRPAVADPVVAEPPASNATAVAEEPGSEAPGAEWVRLKRDDQGRPIAMQTAIVRYRSEPTEGKPPVTVDLIGAVHVGDASYYKELNDRFAKYDALLYELVAPKGTRIEPGTKASNRHMLGAMQNGMKNMLRLEHQLEQVDYTQPNFVHADMSADEFFDSMEARDESFVQMYFRMMGQSIAQQSRATANGATPDLDIMKALFADDPSLQLKIAMAGQLSEMESLLTAFGGEEGSTLITERNKAALKVLREQIDAGKASLGVFYGAGHLADMSERLQQDFAMQAVSVTWLDAWNLAEEVE